MKVKICTGSKCTFYGASGIMDGLLQLQDDLPSIPGMPENAAFEVEAIPCRGFCRDGNHKIAPVVYIDDERFDRASTQQIMEAVITRLQAD